MPPEVSELVMQLINGLACGLKAGIVYTHTHAYTKIREMRLENAGFNEKGRGREGRRRGSENNKLLYRQDFFSGDI